MTTTRRRLIDAALTFASVLVVKTTVAVVAGYGAYFPPDFTSEFLVGREEYFFGPYRAAFVTHLAAGPTSLLLGTLLVSERFRSAFPGWHRRLGRLQVALVVGLVAPSGLWMAPFAAAGSSAAVSLALLAAATAGTAIAGWRAAMSRRFAAHRRWMWRNYLLLCSAVVIRVLGGAGAVFGITAPWYDPAITWASWVFPLAVFEVVFRYGKPPQNSPGTAPTVSRA